MRKAKQQSLEASGWRVGSAEDFLELSPDEALVVELKLRLSDALRARRAKMRLSQEAVATRLGSSQSRVAKMEAGDASVSFDLLVRALLGMGATLNDVATAIQREKRHTAARGTTSASARCTLRVPNASGYPRGILNGIEDA